MEYIFHSYSAYLISQLIALRSVCVLLPVFYFILTVWSLPWLYALECVHVMQRAVQHSRVQTQRHRGEKNKQLEGKLVNRVLDGSGYSNLFFQNPIF